MVVHLVTGPPCSGKTTHVAEHAGPDAVVIDLDAMAHALGYPAEHIDWADDAVHPARAAAMVARASLLKRLASLGPEVWVIGSSRDTLRMLPTGAEVHVVDLDPGMTECVARAERAGRSKATLEQIRSWYDVVDSLGFAVGQTSQNW